MQLDLFKEPEEEIPTGPTKTCRYCKQEKHYTEFRLRYSGWETDSTKGRDHICRDCTREDARNREALKKTAPPKPDDMICQCCGKEVETFYFDHCHVTNKFRGWVCRDCNIGIGFLGDDIEGVEKALAYLKRHYEKD